VEIQALSTTDVVYIALTVPAGNILRFVDTQKIGVEKQLAHCSGFSAEDYLSVIYQILNFHFIFVIDDHRFPCAWRFPAHFLKIVNSAEKKTAFLQFQVAGTPESLRQEYATNMPTLEIVSGNDLWG
jgi:hypothetical protein